MTVSLEALDGRWEVQLHMTSLNAYLMLFLDAFFLQCSVRLVHVPPSRVEIASVKMREYRVCIFSLPFNLIDCFLSYAAGKNESANDSNADYFVHRSLFRALAILGCGRSTQKQHASLYLFVIRKTETGGGVTFTCWTWRKNH